VEREEFEELVRQAIKSLPKFFRRKMENISIEVEDYPSIEVQRQMGVGPRNLLGLYRGVPRSKRSVWHNFSGPDRISIYQANIEGVARTPDELKKLVREVVMHEIGHYFGLSEEELRAAQEE
jgi:predicted Zn-dependent protease with MMP-like domain